MGYVRNKLFYIWVHILFFISRVFGVIKFGMYGTLDLFHTAWNYLAKSLDL